MYYETASELMTDEALRRSSAGTEHPTFNELIYAHRRGMLYSSTYSSNISYQ